MVCYPTVLRIRPPPPPEASVHIPPRFQRSVLAPLPGSQTTLSVDTLPTTASGAPAVSPASSSKANQKQHFSFDRVFAPQDGQSSLYTVAEDLVGKFTEGFNVSKSDLHLPSRSCRGRHLVALLLTNPITGFRLLSWPTVRPAVENPTRESSHLGSICCLSRWSVMRGLRCDRRETAQSF